MKKEKKFKPKIRFKSKKETSVKTIKAALKLAEGVVKGDKKRGEDESV